MTQHRILIASPMRASDPSSAKVCYGYARTLRRYARDMSVEVLDPRDCLDPVDMDDLGYGPDLVRVRSRIVRIALEDPRNYTAIWWWDTDVICRDPMVAARMLMTGKDIVGAPYPRKAIKWGHAAKWANAQAAAGLEIRPNELEQASMDFPVRTTEEPPGPDGCAPAETVGMGFMITSTKALRVMCEKYRSTLEFGDVFRGQRIPTVGIFQLLMPLERGESTSGPLLSEDYSFCWRARQCGIPVHVYCGPGTPLDHAGEYVYRGTFE